MTEALRALTAVGGRSGLLAMWIATVAFVTVGLIRGSVPPGVLAAVLGLVQVVLIWPAWVAVPIRRFHDMGRPWWWVAVFWGLALIGLFFFIFGLNSTARLFEMSWLQALIEPTLYLERLEALNAQRPEGTSPLKPLGGSAMGGISLAMIFLIIQFGWLHFVPGQRRENAYGPPPDRSAPGDGAH